MVSNNFFFFFPDRKNSFFDALWEKQTAFISYSKFHSDFSEYNL